MSLGAGARMGDRAPLGVTHGLGIAPERARLEIVAARLPVLLALDELRVRELDRDRAFVCVNRDDVAIHQEPDRSAHRRLRADMTDAEAARGAGEPAVGDERDLVAHALAID